jgi:hypothetical protein
MLNYRHFYCDQSTGKTGTKVFQKVTNFFCLFAIVGCLYETVHLQNLFSPELDVRIIVGES